MMYRSRVRRMTLLNPKLRNDRPVAGSVMTASGMRFWSKNGDREELRKNQSDLQPLSQWQAYKDDWEAIP